MKTKKQLREEIYYLEKEKVDYKERWLFVCNQRDKLENKMALLKAQIKALDKIPITDILANIENYTPNQVRDQFSMCIIDFGGPDMGCIGEPEPGIKEPDKKDISAEELESAIIGLAFIKSLMNQ